jgi:2,3-bisphosphoglycerate-independent phosphoglycerate mutase
VPFVIAGSDIAAGTQKTYDEVAAAASGRVLEPGWKLMGTFLGKDGTV